MAFDPNEDPTQTGKRRRKFDVDLTGFYKDMANILSINARQRTAFPTEQERELLGFREQQLGLQEEGLGLERERITGQQEIQKIMAELRRTTQESLEQYRTDTLSQRKTEEAGRQGRFEAGRPGAEEKFLDLLNKLSLIMSRLGIGEEGGAGTRGTGTRGRGAGREGEIGDIIREFGQPGSMMTPGQGISIFRQAIKDMKLGIPTQNIDPTTGRAIVGEKPPPGVSGELARVGERLGGLVNLRRIVENMLDDPEGRQALGLINPIFLRFFQLNEESKQDLLLQHNRDLLRLSGASGTQLGGP